MELSTEEKEILVGAEYIHRRPEQGMQGVGEGWFKPMHVGGSDGSHHSRTLRKMVKKGLIETERNWSFGWYANSRRYRITEPGLQLFKELEAANELRRMGERKVIVRD